MRIPKPFGVCSDTLSSSSIFTAMKQHYDGVIYPTVYWSAIPNYRVWQFYYLTSNISHNSWNHKRFPNGPLLREIILHAEYTCRIIWVILLHKPLHAKQIQDR